jgi:exopolysaccharide biosynthesis polyprenyl glycosylphosphotransferase
MNDFEAAQRPSTLAFVPPVPRLRLVAPRIHPARPAALEGIDSGPALARQFRTRLTRSDVGVVLLVGLIATFGSLLANGGGFLTLATLTHLAIFSLIVVVWIACLWVFRTRDSRVLCVGVTEYKRIVSASTMTFGLLGIAFVIVPVSAARWYFLISLPLGVIGLVLERWLWRKWLVLQSREGLALSRVVVVGTNEEVDYVVRQVRKNSSAAYSVVGVVIDGSTTATRALGVPLSTDLDSVAEHAATVGADAVIVAGSPVGRPEFVHDLAWSLEGTATDLIIATSLANVAGPRIHLRPVEGLPLIHVEIPQFEGGKHVLKRIFDIVFAGACLVVLAPAMALLGLVIMLDSPGPALFRQERVGRDGKSFTMFKFRSMVTTAESDLADLLDQNEGASGLFKLKRDPRVTRVGAFIRKHSLDEFPQLWNILLGDMSVVGPRPPLPREVRDYEDHVHRRLYIRPGLTGMWQVNGRSTLNWEESVQLDLYYVENWSLVGDVVIIWRTVREVSSPIGAF